MAKLAAWSIDARHGEGGSQQSEPRRVGRSRIGLERYLEDWIVNDVTLIGEGITLVGRQVSIDDGRLDLLAVDSRDRWVVIEIKPARLDSDALAQALYYASSLARLDADELYGKLEPGFGEFGDVEMLSTRVKQLLAGEGVERDIALLLVGTGTHSGLERVNEFLGRFEVPISVVSFEVFELEGGPKLLIREVVDEPTRRPPSRRRLSLEAIRAMAIDIGVGKQFDRFVDMSKEAGLAVQAQPASVRIAPQTDRRRFLMWVQPRAGRKGGELGIWVGPEQFAEFFPEVSEKEAIDAIGEYEDGAFLAGEALEERLNEIERFLTDKVQQAKSTGVVDYKSSRSSPDIPSK